MGRERQIDVDQRIGGGEPLPGRRNAKSVNDPFVTAQQLGVRLEVFVVRDFAAIGFELDHVEGIERQAGQFRETSGKRGLTAAGIAEHR
jgi:hypothetical protein